MGWSRKTNIFLYYYHTRIKGQSSSPMAQGAVYFVT